MLAAALRKATTVRAAHVRGLASAVKPVPITVSYGDGIGPEIMESTMDILKAAGASLAPEVIEVGEKVYLKGHSSGIEDSSWESLRRTKVFLKAPITTPMGGGYKSLNVTIRKTLGLYANIRPCQSYHPYVFSRHPDLNMVIVRENEEDLYAGIEHRQTNDVFQCLKVISRPGCEKIVRAAFEYARKNGRSKVTCMVKDNIMKMADGLFYKVFEEIGKREYPDIARDKMIIDIGAALIADQPEKFDVIVTLNLYGDIISDIAAQLTGSVGMGASSNVGESVAMFEAIHGSAPQIAGKGIANPSGLLVSSTQMLTHIGQPAVADKVYNAWLKTLEDGIHTGDIYKAKADGGHSTQKVGTKDFTKAVIERLGEKPTKMKASNTAEGAAKASSPAAVVAPSSKWTAPPETKILNGIDVFVDSSKSPDDLAAALNGAIASVTPDLKLSLITNRGVKVWPQGMPETFCTNHWRCRIRPVNKDASVATPYSTLWKIVGAISGAGVDVIKTENLCMFKQADGSIAAGFSMGQGE